MSFAGIFGNFFGKVGCAIELSVECRYKYYFLHLQGSAVTVYRCDGKVVEVVVVAAAAASSNSSSIGLTYV